MSDFDPYRKWLGIRPEDQPPNHYRLLGISLYEDDPDVIDAAVEQRVTYLQSCSSGPNLKHSQQILNEVAEARNVLLNAEKKDAYDADLKAKIEAEQSAAAADSEDRSNADNDQPAGSKMKRKRVLPSGATSAEPEAASNVESPEADAKRTGSVAAQFRLRRNRSTGLALAVLFGVAATGGLLWWLFKGDGAETIEEIAQSGRPGDTGTGSGETGSGTPGDSTGEPEKVPDGDASTTHPSTTDPKTKPATTTDPKSPAPTTAVVTNPPNATGGSATRAGYDASGIAARQPGIAAQLAGHKSPVVAVAISNDLNTVASAGEDGTVLVHSLADSNRIVDQYKVKGTPLDVAFDTPGNRLAVVTAEGIFLRDIREKKVAWQEGPHPSPRFTSITHRPFTPFYLVGHLDGTSVLRGRGENLNAGGRPQLNGHSAPVTCVAMSASGRIAVTASEDNTLRVWNLDSRTQVNEFPVEAVLKKVAISPDERRIVAISELGLHAWDLHRPLVNPIVPVHDGLVSDVALSGEQPLAVTSGLDGTIQVIDLESLLPTLTLSSSNKATRYLAVSADGVAAVTAGTPEESNSHKVFVWQLPDATPVSFGQGVRPHDVLAHLDVKRDLIRGSWTCDNRVLVSGTEKFNEIHLPATVPEEYTLDIRVRRSNGMGLLRIYLPFQNTVGSLAINAVRGQVSGLEYIDGAGVADNETCFRRDWIVSWKREHTIRATVTKEGIKASVDGTFLFDWKGTPDELFCELDRDPDLPVVREIRLMTASAQYSFSSIQLLPPGGEPSTTSAPPLMIARPERVAAPSDVDVQSEVEKIRNDLAGAYSDTKNRATLIAQLIRMANDAKDAPATQCAAWSEAASLAADGGDATQAFLALDRMTSRYDGSFFEVKEKVFSTLLRKRDTATMAQLAPFGFSWVEDLIDAERLDDATSVLSRTRGASIRLKDQRLRDLADYLNTRIRTLTRTFTTAKESVAKLAEDPDDAAAAEVVGRFRCFSVEDWERGLPLLKNSEDATLKQLAEQDLAQPTAPEEQVALADAWWAYSTTQPVGDRDAIRRRAGVWYIYAIRNLPQIRQAEVRQKELKVPSQSANVSIAAQVDAGDSITIRRDGVVWNSPRSKPGNVHINKFPWDVKADSTLLNRGATRFLPHGIHFGRVRLQKLQGRSNVEMSVFGDEIILKFNDTNSGPGTYQLLLSFGS